MSLFITPKRSNRGLISAAAVVHDSPSETTKNLIGLDWNAGWALQSVCPKPSVWAECNVPASDLQEEDKCISDGLAGYFFQSFESYDGLMCKQGRISDSIIRDILLSRTDVILDRAFAVGLEYGLAGDGLGLKDATPVPVVTPGTPINIIKAIQVLLNQWENHSSYGGTIPTIHVPLHFAPYLQANYLISANPPVEDGFAWKLSLSSYGIPTVWQDAIAPGDPGSEVASPYEGWIYITSDVELAIDGPDYDNTAAMYRKNQTEQMLEKRIAYRFDPCAMFAILATTEEGN